MPLLTLFPSIQRDCFEAIFSCFGQISDFYLPYSIESKDCFCYIEYTKQEDAVAVVKLFEGDITALIDHMILPLIPVDLKESALKELKKITKVELVSKPVLYYNR
jgi:hypothetical protein